MESSRSQLFHSLPFGYTAFRLGSLLLDRGCRVTDQVLFVIYLLGTRRSICAILSEAQAQRRSRPWYPTRNPFASAC